MSINSPIGNSTPASSVAPVSVQGGGGQTQSLKMQISFLTRQKQQIDDNLTLTEKQKKEKKQMIDDKIQNINDQIAAIQNKQEQNIQQAQNEQIRQAERKQLENTMSPEEAKMAEQLTTMIQNVLAEETQKQGQKMDENVSIENVTETTEVQQSELSEEAFYKNIEDNVKAKDANEVTADNSENIIKNVSDDNSESTSKSVSGNASETTTKDEAVTDEMKPEEKAVSSKEQLDQYIEKIHEKNNTAKMFEHIKDGLLVDEFR